MLAQIPHTDAILCLVSVSDISILNMSAPLTPAVFYLLLVLADDDRHGYGIMRAVRERSSGQLTLRTASLYRHLSRLLDEGLVTEAPRPRKADDDPRRGAYYRLTPAGARALAAERDRLAAQLAAADRSAPASRRGRV
jgi:DNA-binding PadR family transcriptional regulator